MKQNNAGQINVELMADRIRFLRKETDISQTALANLLGTVRASVSRWERGLAVPDCRDIAEMSRLFGVSSDYLCGITNHRNNINCDFTEFDMSKINNEGVALMRILYKLISESDSFKKTVEK